MAGYGGGVDKLTKSGKSTVELQPSRIRREPPPPSGEKINWAFWASDSDRDTWVVVVGIALFSIAFAIITIGISDFTSG